MQSRRFLSAIALVLLGCSESPTVPSGPRLLVCPTSTTLTGSFVADPILGGSLTVGGTSITIPSGGVSVPTLFFVTVPASKYMEVEIHADGLTSFLFNQPATISIDYSRCPATVTDDRELQAWHINSLTKALLENMNGTDDKVARKITFTTGHLSGYGVAF